MRYCSRFLVIGILVTNMAVDCAATGRLFRRGCGTCAKHSSCCDLLDCEVSCPLPGCDTLMPVFSDPCCSEAPIVVESANACCDVDERPGETTDIESLPLDESNSTPDSIETPKSQNSVPDTAPLPAEISPTLPSSTPKSTSSLPPSHPAVPTLPETTASPTPAESKPAPSVVGDRYSNDDEIFGPTVGETPEPTNPEPGTIEPPTPEDSVSDIFDEPKPAPTPEPTEDILPPSRSKPQESTPETEEDKSKEYPDFDEIFGNTKPAAAEITPQDNNEEPPVRLPEEPMQSDPDKSKEYFDPFEEEGVTPDDETSALREAGGLRSVEQRTWTDVTARFQCEAKLVRVTTKNVLLRQSSGAEVFVPFKRLGEQDLRFVHQQIVALRVANSRDATAAKLATARSN